MKKLLISIGLFIVFIAVVGITMKHQILKKEVTEYLTEKYYSPVEIESIGSKEYNVTYFDESDSCYKTTELFGDIYIRKVSFKKLDDNTVCEENVYFNEFSDVILLNY